MGRAILGWETLQRNRAVSGLSAHAANATHLEVCGRRGAGQPETFHPSWFVKYCFNLMGRDEAIAFLRGSMNPPPTYLRVNTLAATEEAILQKLEAEGVKLEKAAPLKYTYKVLETKQPLTAYPATKKAYSMCRTKQVASPQKPPTPKQAASFLMFARLQAPKPPTSPSSCRTMARFTQWISRARRMQTWKRETARMGTKIAEPVIADAMRRLPLAAKRT